MTGSEIAGNNCPERKLHPGVICSPQPPQRRKHEIGLGTIAIRARKLGLAVRITVLGRSEQFDGEPDPAAPSDRVRRSWGNLAGHLRSRLGLGRGFFSGASQ